MQSVTLQKIVQLSYQNENTKLYQHHVTSQSVYLKSQTGNRELRCPKRPQKIVVFTGFNSNGHEARPGGARSVLGFKLLPLTSFYFYNFQLRLWQILMQTKSAIFMHEILYLQNKKYLKKKRCNESGRRARTINSHIHISLQD